MDKFSKDIKTIEIGQPSLQNFEIAKQTHDELSQNYTVHFESDYDGSIVVVGERDRSEEEKNQLVISCEKEALNFARKEGYNIDHILPSYPESLSFAENLNRYASLAGQVDNEYRKDYYQKLEEEFGKGASVTGTPPYVAYRLQEKAISSFVFNE